MRRARTRRLALGLFLPVALIGSTAFGSSSSPQRGGTLRVGIEGSSATETNNPFLDSPNGAVLLRRILVYDAVTKLTPAGQIIGAAAGSWRYNKALTELRLTVRKGERFSDGTPMTPADIAYSLRLYGKIGFGFAGIPIDWPKVTVHGADVVAPLLQKRTDVVDNLAQYSAVVKAGTTDFSEAPVGSGPFKIDVLTPGTGVARLVPNPYYPGPVYLDAIDIQSFTDPATETTAFLAGDLDVAIDVGGVNARRAQGVPGVKIDRKVGAVAYPFVMRLDDPPFNNPAVRLALKLAVDRPALVKDVLDGWGTVGNDLFMPSDPDFNNTLPQRKRDLRQAAKLLEGAGYTASRPLKLTLWSTTFAPEMASAATLFVQQLDSGLPMVNAKVQIAPADTYWTDVWLKKPFYTSYLQTFPLTRVMYDTLGFSRGAYNETGMHRADFDALVEKAVTTTDPATRKRVLFAAQKILRDQGGYIVWGYADEIDLARSNVHGLPTAAGKARYSLWRTWLSK